MRLTSLKQASESTSFPKNASSRTRQRFCTEISPGSRKEPHGTHVGFNPTVSEKMVLAQQLGQKRCRSARKVAFRAQLGEPSLAISMLVAFLSRFLLFLCTSYLFQFLAVLYFLTVHPFFPLVSLSYFNISLFHHLLVSLLFSIFFSCFHPIISSSSSYLYVFFFFNLSSQYCFFFCVCLLLLHMFFSSSSSSSSSFPLLLVFFFIFFFISSLFCFFVLFFLVIFLFPFHLFFFSSFILSSDTCRGCTPSISHGARESRMCALPAVSKSQILLPPKAFSPKRGLVFAVNGARCPRRPLPPPQKIPRTRPWPSPPPPLSWKNPPPGIFSKTPTAPQEKGGGVGEGPGVGGGDQGPIYRENEPPFRRKRLSARNSCRPLAVAQRSACDPLCCSGKLEKAGTVNFKKHPARKVGTRSRQCGPKVPGRFAFPSARDPGICSISRFGEIFPAISRDFPSETPVCS